MNYEEPRYVKEGDLYQFYMGEEKLFETKEVSVLLEFIDDEHVILHKHGLTDNVEASYQRMVENYKSIQDNTSLGIGELKMFTSEAFDVEELNKVVNITGYGHKFVRFHEDKAAQETITDSKKLKF